MRTALIEQYFRAILEQGMGLDLSSPNLRDTPKRVARMWKDMLSSIDKEFDRVTVFPNEHNYDQLIMLDKIFFVSMCSHHFLPFYGKAYIGYIPDKYLIGASKAARIVNHYAKKPQLQEHLCHETAQCFEKHVHPKGLIVYIQATHGCMKCRGVKQYGDSRMSTTVVTGVLKEDQIARSEALTYIQNAMLRK